MERTGLTVSSEEKKMKENKDYCYWFRSRFYNMFDKLGKVLLRCPLAES